MDTEKEVFEELPSQTMKLILSNIEALVLELKHLPEDLKYVFLVTKETFSVIISMYLSENQEEYLLFVLHKHKGALV